MIVLLLSLFIFWSWPDQYLHIVACDVGQGDAILLSQGFTQVLVDAGRDEQYVLRCLRNQLPFWDRQIEWIVPTHLDADHIGGFPAILDRFKVLHILLPRDTKETTDFERFEKAVLREQQTGGVVEVAQMGASINAHDAWKLKVLYAPIDTSASQFIESQSKTEHTLWDKNMFSELNPADSNNRSTVLSLQYDQVSLLLIGDLEKPVEQALIKAGVVTSHTILKVGHHGSKSSSSEEFIKKVLPEVVLISVGKNNRYGHPSPVVLDRLIENGASSLLRTDELGTVVLKSDGQKVWLVSN